MKNNILFVFNAEANKKRVNNNTLFVFDAEANNKKRVNNNTLFVNDAEANKKWFTWGVRKFGVVKLVFR